jgi:hypothetical protein
MASDDAGGGLLSWAAATEAEERGDMSPRQKEVAEHGVAHTDIEFDKNAEYAQICSDTNVFMAICLPFVYF